jgi:hypothetical protein
MSVVESTLSFKFGFVKQSLCQSKIVKLKLNMKVLFEGNPYPFEYDKDRGFIKLEIPLVLKKYKNFYIIQIQIQDKAGNLSRWFTDIVSL